MAVPFSYRTRGSTLIPYADTIITCCPLRWNAWISSPDDKPAHQRAPKGFREWFFSRPPPPMQHLKTTELPPQPPIKDAKARQEVPPKVPAWPELNWDDPMSVSRNIIQRLLKQLSPLQEKGTITTVYDMASLVTTCCIDVFDQNNVPEEFQFFEYFETSISIVVRLNAKLQASCIGPCFADNLP